MLTINNLHVNVEGKEILKGIDLAMGSGEVHAIMDAVGVPGVELHLVPGVKLEREENVQFKVDVGSLPVEAGAGVAHAPHHMSSRDALALLHRGAGQVSV